MAARGFLDSALERMGGNSVRLGRGALEIEERALISRWRRSAVPRPASPVCPASRLELTYGGIVLASRRPCDLNWPVCPAVLTVAQWASRWPAGSGGA